MNSILLTFTIALSLIMCPSVSLCFSQSDKGEHSFVIENDQFQLDGNPIQIISGEIHYFRIPEIYWEDRLQRVLALGMNAVQIYVPWNFHQSTPNIESVQLENDANLGKFLDLCFDLGLLVLLRPGPYICAEWEFGGLPSWLLDPNIEFPVSVIRTNDSGYLHYGN